MDLRCGHVLDKLAEIDAGSIQCAITSPPYWGLRDYGLEPVEWGGASDCEHEWGDTVLGDSRGGSGTPTDKNNRGEGYGRDSERGQFCQKCGAWRGQLGLEPMPEQYVAHLVEVFRAVRRVLRDDGTLWVNLGSSYASDHLASSVVACGNGDREQRDSEGSGPACSRSDGGHPSDSRSRHAHTPHTVQERYEVASRPYSTGRDSGRVDSEPTSLAASLPDVQGSTTCATSRSAPASSCPATRASVCLPGCQTSSAGAPGYVDMEPCSGDRPSPLPTSCGHTSGTEPSSGASDPPCGRAGWTLPYYSIAFPAFKPKDLVPIPWMVALALVADGWWLRSDIIWSKSNPMPESVRDRPTSSHEYVFMLTKRAKYYYDADAIAEPSAYPGDERHLRTDTRKEIEPMCVDGGSRVRTGNPTGATRNKRTVWTINPQGFSEAHFATFPEKLVEVCMKAGTSERGCCPKCGAPWTRMVERTVGRSRNCPKTCAAHRARGGVGDPVGTVGQSGGGRIDGFIQTIGWQPSCECNAGDPVGCMVLDPFIGSGTVGLVAEKLGRRWIGIEANPEYVAIARRRLHQPTLWTEEADR